MVPQAPRRPTTGPMENSGGDPDTTASRMAAKKRRNRLLNRDVVIRTLIHRHKVKKPSPLVQLKDILEETPDKGRFVGDTMFWKYFEDINIQRIYDTKSVEYRNLRVMFWEVCFYLFLLLMFTIYAYQLQSRDVYDAREEQVNYWSGCDSVDTCQINQVESVSSFWGWMQTQLVEKAFTEYEDEAPSVADIITTFPNNNFPLMFHPRFVGPQMSNIILGSVRMRQLRVLKNQGCQVSKLASHVFPDCYAPYSDKWKSTKNYAPRFGPTYLRDAFRWQSEESTHQVALRGAMNMYGGDGFVADLPFNKSESATMIQVDTATRAVHIELSVLNSNVNVIVNTRIIFEFSATGSVVGQVKSNAARVFLITPATKAGAAQSVFILQLLLLLVFLGFTFYVFWLMYKTCHNVLGENPLKRMRKSSWLGIVSIILHTIYHYFGYGWNMVDLTIILLFYIHMGFRIDTYLAIGREHALAPDVIGHPEKFMPFSRVFSSIQAGNNVLSLLALVIWGKLFKYLCMSSYFRMIVRILERCAARLLVFSILLLVVFFGFAVAFFVGFGGTHSEFSTISGSFLVLFFLLIDGYQLSEEWFVPGKDSWMPIIFFVYIALIYFVILNIFIAVVLDVYATSEHNVREVEQKKNPMAVFLWTYYNWMKGLSLLKEESEEYLKGEDLSITLEQLPGIVRKKWIEKKRKMQRIANEAFAGMELFPDDKEILAGDSITVSDWMLPNSKAVVKQEAQSWKPVPLYEVPPAALKQEVMWEQLQRLMDEDQTMPILLGTTKAVEVIRRFKKGNVMEAIEDVKAKAVEATSPVSAASSARGRPQISAAKHLQGKVFEKIDELERVQLDADEEVPDVPEIKELTEEMSSAISEVRNEFRVQLTTIIEATAQLFEHLVDLTQGIDAVRHNQASVMEHVHANAVAGSVADGSISVTSSVVSR